MALFHSFSCFIIIIIVFLSTLMSLLVVSHQQPLLDPAEQDAVYHVLDSINPTIPWRSLYPDDLCSSAPHGVACDYFTSDSDSETDTTVTAHVTQLSFGYVSDYTPNPPCSSNSTLSPLLFTSFSYLRKLFFYKCFNDTKRVSLFSNVSPSFLSTLEEAVLTGNGVFGEIPDWVGDLVNLEELTLSRNQLNGGVTLNFPKKLKVLDLSHNHFDGYVPESLGNLTELLKLDLSFNGFYGKISDGLNSRNMGKAGGYFGNRVVKSGTCWNIPVSMAVHLRNLCYLGLDNNKLEGTVPVEFGLLKFVNEINLENNSLSGRVPFSEFKIGQKLKLEEIQSFVVMKDMVD
ncbi:protein too many mouths [Quercus suber]|uniref:Protein too many mouths n=1 Tax=Quercus suber TaxID=58331 RepID=A0AAW0K2A5_QUESU